MSDAGSPSTPEPAAPFAELSPPYSTLVADPPWHYDNASLRNGIPYSLMDTSDLAALPVGDLAAPGAHLYLWATQRHLWDARGVAEAWGWRVCQVLTWCKPQGFGFGPLEAFANNTEFLLFCRRPVGQLISAARAEAGLTQYEVERHVRGDEATRLISRWELGDCYPSPDQWDSMCDLLGLQRGLASAPNREQTCWWSAPRGAHSEKPAQFGDVVERVSPGPYLELFARAPRLGWDSWGYGYESEVA